MYEHDHAVDCKVVNDNAEVGKAGATDAHDTGVLPDKQTTGNEPEHKVVDDACEYEAPPLVEAAQMKKAC